MWVVLVLRYDAAGLHITRVTYDSLSDAEADLDHWEATKGDRLEHAELYYVQRVK